MTAMLSGRILVVDDEQQIRRALDINLRAHGYEVRLAASGEDALLDVAANPPDLVLLDLGLPDLDGVELCRLLRAAIPVAGVPKVAFLAVQVRMHPRTRLIVHILRELVRPFPVAARVVPEREQQRWYRWCGRSRQRRLELVERHCVIVARRAARLKPSRSDAQA